MALLTTKLVRHRVQGLRSAARNRPAQVAAVAVPLALAVILALHPLMGFDPFALEGRLGRWFVVHYGMLLLAPALTWVAWRMLDGLRGRLVTVARAALLPFAVFYAAYDALAGIGTGMLVRSALDASPEVRAAVTPLLAEWWTTLNPHWLATVSAGAWLVFAIAAATAHHRAGSHPVVVGGLGLASLFALAHGSIPASVTLVAFALAVGFRHTAPRRTA